MRVLATIALLPVAALAQSDPQPAVAALMHYTAGLPACLDAARTPDQARGCIGPASQACMDNEEGGFSTVGMMFCTLAEYHAWDDLLNATYRVTMEDLRARDAEEAASFPEFAGRAEALRDAQRGWIAFKDGECALAYAMWGAGSMRQIAGASCLLDMTATRTIELKFLGDGMR